MPKTPKPKLERELINNIPHYDDPKDREAKEKEMWLFIYHAIHDKERISTGKVQEV